MAKTPCEDCGEIVTITPTGRKQGAKGTSTWWRVLEHWDKKTGQPCSGSGRLV